MIIGIDGSRAFLEKRTGIEEYSFQVIKHLADKLADCEVRLYLRKNQKASFDLPENWKVKVIRWPFLWTQFGLSLEMLFHPVDVLFIPAHVVPLIHAKNTIVVVHGLEFEFIPKAYSFWAKMYMRRSIKSSCRWAKKIIAVSENTKKDLVRLYKVPENKVEVIYEGVNFNSLPLEKGDVPKEQRDLKNFPEDKNPSLPLPLKRGENFLLFIGRLEERKNISGIVEAFEILKEKYKIPHKLILAGKPGYGYESIKYKVESSKHKEDIIIAGYVNEEEKQELLKSADVFLFPTFYEGFGLPILEAEALGAPVVASNNSSMPEVAGESAILVNPKKPKEIATAVQKILSDEKFKKDLIQKGLENVQRFDWGRCTKEIAEVLLGR